MSFILFNVSFTFPYQCFLDAILKKDFKDGVKLYLEDNTSWILVRPSGTEPLLRIYFESDSEEKIVKFKELVA